MDQQIKKEWVAALRSGKYEQGQLRLRTGDKYCCLGVLCEVMTTRLNERWHRRASGWAFVGSNITLPRDVYETAGLDDDSPIVEHDGIVTSLADLNDEGTPFSKIADIIEAQL